jgi:hypothetical protein
MAISLMLGAVLMGLALKGKNNLENSFKIPAYESLQKRIRVKLFQVYE